MNISNLFLYIANASFVFSIIFFFFALAQLIQAKKLLSNYFLFIIYLAVGIQFNFFWLYWRPSPIFEKYFFYSDSAFLFLIGPYLYLFLYYMTGHTKISLRTILLHGIPFVVTLFLIEGLNLSLPALSDKKDIPIFLFIMALSYLSLLLYSIRMHRVLRFHYRDNQTPEIKALTFSIKGCIVSSIILIPSVIWEELLILGNIAFICIPLFFIFFLIRYPHYFSNVKEELREIKYANSQLKGTDKVELIFRLESLMDREKVYKNSSLTLKGLSGELEITSSQLSEFLNSHYDSNFSNFINSYRIEEVKAILDANPDANILQTAIDCGFNSKTTFNRVFRNHTGLTPSQFREKIGANL